MSAAAGAAIRKGFALSYGHHGYILVRLYGLANGSAGGFLGVAEKRGRDGHIGPYHAVGFELRLRRGLLRIHALGHEHIYRKVVGAHVKAPVFNAEKPVESARKYMLGAVHLHMVEAPLPVQLAEKPLFGRLGGVRRSANPRKLRRSFEIVLNFPAFFVLSYIHEPYAAYAAEVAGLAAPVRREYGFLEHNDGPAVFHSKRQNLKLGFFKIYVLLIEFYGRHKFSFKLAPRIAPLEALFISDIVFSPFIYYRPWKQLSQAQEMSTRVMQKAALKTVADSSYACGKSTKQCSEQPRKRRKKKNILVLSPCGKLGD